MSTKLTVPLPLTSGVTLNSIQPALLLMLPRSSLALPLGPGWVSQVIVFSAQPLPLAKTCGPLVVPSVTNTRSFALCTLPLTPLTVKRM